MTSPVTLADLIRDDKLLWVYCGDCGHERDVNPANVPLPGDKRMKCSKCGSRKIDARPELYPGGIAAMRGRWRQATQRMIGTSTSRERCTRYCQRLE